MSELDSEYRLNLWFRNKHQEKINKIRELVFEILDDAVKEGIDITYAVSILNSVDFILQWSLEHREYRKRLLKYFGLYEFFRDEFKGEESGDGDEE